MPSGGSDPLTEEEMKYVWDCYQAALKHGLVHEWLDWFAGGMKMGKSPMQAALDACIEWDF